MKVLVTGGAGYIGSHTVQMLIDSGHEVVVYDNLTTGFREAVPRGVNFVFGDVRDAELLKLVMRKEKVEGIIHFAAMLNVNESLSMPYDYYETNVTGMVNVIKAMVATEVKNIVFSSTAAVFGDQIQDRAIVESDPKSPLNPYGRSKLFSEQILKDAAKVHGFRYAILRYFNVAGAATNGLNGQRTKNAYHLIHLGSQAATGKRSQMAIYGSDYPTKDGTCVRDYIHVEDLAEIHLLALGKLFQGGQSDEFNCGYGHGFTVREVLQTLQQVSGVNFPIIESERRPGDPSSLVADSKKLQEVLGWVPQRDDLKLICSSAIAWEKKF